MNNDFPPQIHNRYEGKDISKHKRNLVIAGGVTLSVIVSPVVAAVTVGKKEVLIASLFPLNFLSFAICFSTTFKLFKRVSLVGHRVWKLSQNIPLVFLL